MSKCRFYIGYRIILGLFVLQWTVFAAQVDWQSIARQSPENDPIAYVLDADAQSPADLTADPGLILNHYREKVTDTFVAKKMDEFLKSDSMAAEGLDVMAGQLDYPRFDPVVIKDKTGIWSDSMYPNRTWHWNHQQLYAILQLMAAAEQAATPDDRINVLTFIESFVRDWAHDNFSESHPSLLSWHDHATALRLRNLLFLFEYLRRDESADPAFLTQLLRLCHTHMLVLSDDAFYKRRTNHGLDQSFILYWATRLHPLMQDSEWIGSIASERLDDEINFMFTAEGVHVENSPGYHKGVLGTLEFVRDLLDFYGDSAEADPLAVLLDKAWTYLAYIIKPDGRLPLLGDTYTSNMRSSSLHSNGFPGHTWYVYSATAGVNGQRPPWVDWVAQTAGYAIFRDRWPDPEEFDQGFYLVFKSGFRSQYHRHDDDLSFVLTAYGEDWLIDSGGYNYQEKDPMRIHLRSARAHNSVMPRGDWPVLRYLSQTPPGTGILDYGLGQAHSHVTGQSMMHDGLEMQRRLDYEKPGVVILQDKVRVIEGTATPPGLDVVLHFPMDKSIEIKDQRVKVISTDQTTTLTIEPQSAVQDIKLESGVREPAIRGWRSLTFGHLEPSQAVTISYKPTPPDTAMTTKLSFEHGQVHPNSEPAAQQQTKQTGDAGQYERLQYGQGAILVTTNGDIDKVLYAWNDKDYVIPADYQWDKPLEDNKNWSHGIDSLRWLPILLKHAPENAQADSLLKRYVTSFYHHHYKSDLPPARYFYIDHTWAIRLEFLADCYSYYSTLPDPPVEFVNILHEMIENHIELGTTPGRIFKPNVFHNHQSMLHMALLKVLVKLPKFDTPEGLKRQAEQVRLTDQIHHMFTANGMTREHSTNYQLYNLGIVIDTITLFEQLELDTSDLYSICRNAQECIAYFLMPDMTMPAIGDSRIPYPLSRVDTLLRILDDDSLELAHVYDKKDMHLPHQLMIWPQAHIGIIRQLDATQELSHLFFMASNLSRVHKHDDDLSFTFFTKGHRLVVDTAYDDYLMLDATHKRLIDYYRLPTAHNVVLGSKAPWQPQGDQSMTFLTHFGVTDSVKLIRGETRRAKGMTVTRTLALLENTHLFVIDQVLADQPQEITQLFHVDPELKVTREGKGFQCAGDGFTGRIIPLSQFDTVELYSGAGHEPPAFTLRDRKVLDSTVVRLSVDNTDKVTMKTLISGNPEVIANPDVQINGNQVLISYQANDKAITRTVDLTPIAGSETIRH